jgi:hypothetical protein
MSKKDFELIATILQNCHPGVALSSDNRAVIQWSGTVKAFRDELWATNNRFDGDRFERACQPGANVKRRVA